MAALPVPAVGQEPATRTIIEELVAAQNPCAGLSTEILGQPVGIDRLDEVVLREADASLRGDNILLSLSGRLGCRTSDAGFIKGDASATVSADAEVSLADCEAPTVQVQLSDFGGSFAGLLGALGPVLEEQLAEAMRPKLVEACHDLRAE
ncbi:hypothetical protein ACFP76_11100 [Paracoccus aerius]|uniref:hypothetical protein n=1 Tax=Paracoccus aerius TaxID=1915382 RepID=UPI00361E3344